MTKEQINAAKRNVKECADCLGCGQAYWVNNFHEVPPRHKGHAQRDAEHLADELREAKGELARVNGEVERVKRQISDLSPEFAPKSLRMVLPMARGLRKAARLLTRQ